MLFKTIPKNIQDFGNEQILNKLLPSEISITTVQNYFTIFKHYLYLLQNQMSLL